MYYILHPTATEQHHLVTVNFDTRNPEVVRYDAVMVVPSYQRAKLLNREPGQDQQPNSRIILVRSLITTSSPSCMYL